MEKAEKKTFGLHSLLTDFSRLNALLFCFSSKGRRLLPLPTNWTGREGIHRPQEGFLLRTHLSLYLQFWPQAFSPSFPKSDFSPTGCFQGCLTATSPEQTHPFLSIFKPSPRNLPSLATSIYPLHAPPRIIDVPGLSLLSTYKCFAWLHLFWFNNIMCCLIVQLWPSWDII